MLLLIYPCAVGVASNPNKGPYTVPVEWTALNSSVQNYLREAFNFSLQSFDDDKLANYRFWINFQVNGTKFDSNESRPVRRVPGMYGKNMNSNIR